jgi:hypothetical protein
MHDNKCTYKNADGNVSEAVVNNKGLGQDSTVLLCNMYVSNILHE